MFNDSDITDLLESKIQGFTAMTKDELIAFSEKYSLTLSSELMFHIQCYFKNEMQTQPTHNQIKLFDRINQIRTAQKKDFLIYSATSEGGDSDYIMQTSKDLLKKHTVCQPKTFGAMPISVAARVSYDYHKYIGTNTSSDFFIPSLSTKPEGYYIHTEEDIPLFNLCIDSDTSEKDQVSSANDKNAWVMLCPISSDIFFDYNTFADSFTKLYEVESLISELSKVSNEFGLLDVIKKERGGIFINLSNIPEIDKDENGKVIYLESLVTDCKNRYIFTAPAVSVAMLDRIAGEYGLRACIFAIRNTTKVISWDTVKNPILQVSFNFLDSLINFREHKQYVFSDETNSTLDKKAPVYLTDRTAQTRRTYRAERILKFNKAVATATSRTLYSSPFKTSAVAVLDVASTLIAKGVPKSEIKLSIAYSFPCGTDNSIELGKNLASVLGAYRSMIELCLSDAPPRISYDKSERSITCIASAKPPIKKINGSFGGENSLIFFIPYKFLQDGCPDYPAYRKMIEEFSYCIENDLVISAFAINENLKDVIENASQTVALNFSEGFDINDFSNAHGLLFELKNNCAFAFEDAILVATPTIKTEGDKNF